ncbi:MAG: energy transducer TonB [Janthinobacterium lividum]
MMENQPIVQLNFTCNRNWEDMTTVEGGRFCNDCQKKVIDFTDKTNDEIAAYLMNSTTKVCGRFQQSQLAPSLPKPIWKHWLSAAAMFAAVFIGIKEASAQTNNLSDSSTSAQKNKHNNSLGGEIVLVSNNIPTAPAQKIYAFNEVDVIPSFFAGEKAFIEYLHKNIVSATNVDANGIVSFVVDKYGNIIKVTIIKSTNVATDAEAIKAFQNSPRWKPGTKNGEAVAVRLALPFSFTKKIMEQYKN